MIIVITAIKKTGNDNNNDGNNDGNINNNIMIIKTINNRLVLNAK